MADVAVLHHVRFPFDTQFPFAANLRFGTVLFEVLERVDFAPNKPTLEIGVDHSGGLRGGRTTWNRPCADLFFTGGKVTIQPQRAIRFAGQDSQSGLGQTDRF